MLAVAPRASAPAPPSMAQRGAVMRAPTASASCRGVPAVGPRRLANGRGANVGAVGGVGGCRGKRGGMGAGASSSSSRRLGVRVRAAGEDGAGEGFDFGAAAAAVKETELQLSRDIWSGYDAAAGAVAGLPVAGMHVLETASRVLESASAGAFSALPDPVRESVVWPGGYCSPRRPTHLEPSSLELNGTL